MFKFSGVRKVGVVSLAIATGVLGMIVPSIPAGAAVGSPMPRVAAADVVWPSPAPMQQSTSDQVTADVLPTVQIDNGVVWSQVVIGNTVYAGGSFANTRPSGAAAGTNLTPRANLLSFDITTGNLITSFAPQLDGQVRAVVKSPDGSRIYVGGDFSTADGQSRTRVAAYSTSTGQLISTFRPVVSGGYVTSLTVTAGTVYIGGLFGSVSGVSRRNLAAVDAISGAVKAWSPTTDQQADALVMTPDNTKVIVGGRFGYMNDVTQRGLGAVDATTGALVPWEAPNYVKNGTSSGIYKGKAGIWSLYSDGVSIFGSGWVYATADVGNLEGVFSANPNTGAINWIEACHGDSYQMWSDTKTVYTTGHKHYCAHMGGFPESSPRTTNTRRATAWTADRKGTVAHDIYAGGTYYDWQGWAAPGMVNWFPDVRTGTYTGQGQGGWTMTGNDRYVVMGGEFPDVNLQPQNGLARFAKPAYSPHAEKPRVIGDNFKPTLVSLGSGKVRVSWQSNWDRDDLDLTYKVFRNNGATPVYQVTAASTFWNRPTISYIDSGLTPGATYQYKVSASDNDGNVSPGSNVSIVATGGAQSAYADRVLADGATPFWRLGEASGSVAVDTGGSADGTVGAGVTRGQAGAINGDTDTASAFDGTSSGTVASNTAATAPDTFTASAWFKTGTTAGGKILGYGNTQAGTSASYDRHIYMDATGRIWFGVYLGGVRTINSSASYNDNNWHQVTASLGSNGMTLWLDGVQVANRLDTTSGQPYSGYWRVGGDNIAGWPFQPLSSWFAGTIDEVAIFPSVLGQDAVVAQYVASGRSLGNNTPPTAAFTFAASGLTATFDGSGSTDPDGVIQSYRWNFGDGSVAGTGATPSHSYAAAGTFQVTLTVTDDKGGTGTVTKSVTVSHADPVAAFTFNTDGLSATFTGSGTATDGAAITGYSWNFGDGSVAGTGATPTHSFAAAGTFQVALTVSDDKGGTGTITKSVTVSHAAPTAAFTFQTNELTASFAGSGTAADGAAITGYSWNFGDGSVAGTGATPSHSYAAAGSYQVTLTVTDDKGAKGTTTKSVTVAAAPVQAVVAADAFERTTDPGWGSATTGGAWSLTGTLANFSVGGGAGKMSIAAGITRTATLNSVSARDVDGTLDVVLDRPATGNGTSLLVPVRRTAGGEYRMKITWAASGQVSTSLTKVVSGAETTLAIGVAVSGVTTADTLRLRFQATGNGTTTLQSKLWKATGTEPTAWVRSATDSTAALQVPGSIGVIGYVTSNATGTPVVMSVDNLSFSRLAPN